MGIHPTAMVSPKAELGRDVEVGPNVIIEDDVTIGDNTVVMAGAYIRSFTTMGKDCKIHMYAVIGHDPQDHDFANEPSYCRIGDRNVIREFATIHRGTKPGSATIIGNDNFIMGQTHIGHNCKLGDRTKIVNTAMLAGYVEVEDDVFISACNVIHQFSLIGKMAIISGLSAVNKDVPPFMAVGGRPAVVTGVNNIALKRAGIGLPRRRALKKAYKLLYLSGYNTRQAVKRIKKLVPTPEIEHLLAFIDRSERGICRHEGRMVDRW